MKKYFIDMYAIIKAKNKREASEIAQKIVNTRLDKETEKKIIRFSYDSGWGEDTIQEYEGE